VLLYGTLGARWRGQTRGHRCDFRIGLGTGPRLCTTRGFPTAPGRLRVLRTGAEGRS